jgi:hypothetical protein
MVLKPYVLIFGPLIFESRVDRGMNWLSQKTDRQLVVRIEFRAKVTSLTTSYQRPTWLGQFFGVFVYVSEDDTAAFETKFPSAKPNFQWGDGHRHIWHCSLCFG